jgi:hypothetical protein
MEVVFFTVIVVELYRGFMSIRILSKNGGHIMLYQARRYLLRLGLCKKVFIMHFLYVWWVGISHLILIIVVVYSKQLIQFFAEGGANMVNPQLKHLVDVMCGIMESFGKDHGLDSGVGDAAKFELASFMMYLSASDGTIRWEEASVISELCDLALTPETLGDFIRKHNIYSTEFEKKVPLSFQMMVDLDNAIIKAGVSPDEATGSSGLLDVYKAVGGELIQSDGDIHDNEVSDYNTYIEMLEEYRAKNFIGDESKTTGFVKNSGASSVSAPPKTGSVEAPKKG